MTQTGTITKIYRNDATGYTVTLIDNGRGYAEVTDSLNYRFPMVGADYPHASALAKGRAGINGAVEVPAPAQAQMASPLATEAQVRSARPLASGATLTMPERAQARCLSWASPYGTVRRGYASPVGATATLSQLLAMSRRGWFDLDHPIRPTLATITDTGRRALAAYVAKHGEVL